ncbi:MAG: urease accessory protein UreE [Inquilinaceae bacterium]
MTVDRIARVVAPAGSFSPGAATVTATLDFDQRHRRRLRLTADDGADVLLDLATAAALRDGDGLVLGDGGMIRVKAAPEPVADIVCATPEALVRVAWHLGNRHLPTQVLGDRLRIRDDHVIVAMAEGLGAQVIRHRAPFDPEGGAYGHGHGHHHFDEDHDHSHGHGHSHGSGDDR